MDFSFSKLPSTSQCWFGYRTWIYKKLDSYYKSCDLHLTKKAILIFIVVISHNTNQPIKLWHFLDLIKFYHLYFLTHFIFFFMVQTNFSSLNNQVNHIIEIGGFVNSVRDHGGLIFIDLRSQSDLVQCVINPENNQEIFDLAQTIGSESVLKITGKIVNREAKLINPKIISGKIEIIVEKLEIVAKANVLPFEIDGQNVANEELRLKYRYLDLRRNKLKEMLATKSKLFLAVRNWFDAQNFVEVQTPILANSSPEGARDFLIPSRLHPGHFYALPQAPQQFKQLLMVAGFNRYFQIAPCFRDEDPRSDRHPGDFYQIDAEMAWSDQDDIYDFNWQFIQEVLTKFTTKKLDPEFTKIRYDDGMDWFGSDKPDLRIKNNQNKNQGKINPDVKKDWDISTLQIETERLILKPVSLDYAEDIFREFTPEVTQNLLTQPTGNFEDTRKFILKNQEKMQQKMGIQMVILNKNGEFLGITSLNNIGKPELLPSIWLKTTAQNQGFGNEAFTAMFEWAKKHFNFEYIAYGVFEGNERSFKIAKKLGGKFVLDFEMPIKDGRIVKVLEYHIPNPGYEKPIQTQDKNWIIDNLGWLDTKHIFRNSGFKAFADLCEPAFDKDHILKTNEYTISLLNEQNQDVIEKLANIHLKYLPNDVSDEAKEYTVKNFSNIVLKNNRLGQKAPALNLGIKNQLGEIICVVNIVLDKEIPSAFNNKGIPCPFIGFNNLEKNPFNFEKLVEFIRLTIEWSNWLNFPNFYFGGNIHNEASLDQIFQNLPFEFILEKKQFNHNEIHSEVEIAKIKNPNYQPSNSRVQALVVKNAVDKFTRSDLDKIQELGRSFGLPGLAYIQYLENETKSPILKFLDKAKQLEIQNYLGAEAGDLVLFVAHSDKNLVHKAQNAIRKHIAQKLDLIDNNSLKFAWVYDFPFFEETDDGKIDFAHNPFGIFQNWAGLTHLETLQKARAENRLLELRAIQYDIACNGYEVLSGGRRNNIPECLMEGFKLVGYTEEEVKEKFGHMMEAYSYGAPTHAGFAWGIDRLFMVLVDEDNIRETIAFPKNGSGMDLMMNSPSTVRESQLKELSIKNI